MLLVGACSAEQQADGPALSAAVSVHSVSDAGPSVGRARAVNSSDAASAQGGRGGASGEGPSVEASDGVAAAGTPERDAEPVPGGDGHQDASDTAVADAAPPFPLSELPDTAGALISYAQSGTRLVALGYVAEPNTMPVFWTLRDTEHGFDCSFMRGKDEQLHCVPSKTTEVLYLDPECAQPLAPDNTPRRPVSGYRRIRLESGDWVSAVGESGAPLVPTEPSRLPIHDLVYRVGELEFSREGTALEDVPEGYYEWDGVRNECVARDWFRMEVPSLYRLELVAVPQLVQGHVEVIELEDDLFLERVVTVDGAQISAGLWSGARRCGLHAGDLCVPLPVVQSSFWIDECEEQLFATTTPPSGDGVLYGVDGVDVFELEYVSRGDELMLYNQVEDCVVVDSSAFDQRWMYMRTRQVTQELTALERSTFSSGRLRPEWLTARVANHDATVLVEFLPHYTAETLSLSVTTDDGSVCVIQHLGHPDGFGGALEQARCNAEEPIPLTLVEL